MKKGNKVLCIFAICVSLLFLACFVAVKSITYRCEDSSWNESTSDVQVSVNKDVIFYDGPGTTEALIFYPGGFVEFDCYSELLKAIAARGIDCFSVRMPLNFAFLGANKANKILSSYDYESWYIGGHSLGGVVASKFANENNSKVKGVVLFASYSIYDLTRKGLTVVSVYGSNDQVLNRKAYEENRANLPLNLYELEIEGANHCQFGNYGFQKGDGVASISSKEQINTAADYIKSNL